MHILPTNHIQIPMHMHIHTTHTPPTSTHFLHWAEGTTPPRSSRFTLGCSRDRKQQMGSSPGRWYWPQRGGGGELTPSESAMKTSASYSSQQERLSRPPTAPTQLHLEQGATVRFRGYRHGRSPAGRAPPPKTRTSHPHFTSRAQRG